MNKVITKLKSAGSKALKKVVATLCTAAIAVSAMAVNVFAVEEGGGSSVDISTVTNSLQSSLIDLATKAGIACGAVVGAGLTIFGIKWVVKKIMGFFKVIGS